jgi:hypothetical protein
MTSTRRGVPCPCLCTHKIEGRDGARATVAVVELHGISVQHIELEFPTLYVLGNSVC